jgi:DNA-binding response OmpR family regulator
LFVKVLIVEDEMLVAMNMAAVLEDAGHEAVGIAADTTTAYRYADHADVAFVDVNLRDGPTGPGIGARLAAEWGMRVIFITANPRQLGDGIPGTLGVMGKPCNEDDLLETLAYAAGAVPPPSGFQPFARTSRLA